MARKTLAAASGGSTALATIDQELSQEVAALKQQIGQPGGRAIKIKNTGFISPEGMDLGNEIQIVVLDFISKNMFYDRPYDPQSPSPPACYAQGRVIDEMASDPESPVPQADKCKTCPLNQFGSGNNGKSKACKNTRELAVLLVDPENPDALLDPAAPIYTLSVPPTGLRAFDGAVASIARSLAGPPLKAILTATVKDAGTYGLLSFVDPVPNPHYAQHVQRRKESVELLERKPDFSQYAQPKAVRPRAIAKPAVRRVAGTR
jgi:hypothetical protein